MIDNYHIDEFGVIHQTEYKTFTYDKEYMDYYEGLKERTIKLGYLRLGLITGILKRLPFSVLELGYGIGSFLDACQKSKVDDCFGTDIKQFPLPDNCKFIPYNEINDNAYEVVGMFDVLEHVPDPTFIKHLDTRYLAISVPYCRWRELGDEWFKNWRMRLPDEHIHHYDIGSLGCFMDYCGYDMIHSSHIEDGLRLREGEDGPNIITAIFKQR